MARERAVQRRGNREAFHAHLGPVVGAGGETEFARQQRTQQYQLRVATADPTQERVGKP
jgi:hypothetical protein